MAKKYWWEDDDQQNNSQNSDAKSETKSHWWEDSSVSSKVADNITTRVNTWLKNNSIYINNYRNRNSGRKYNYQDSYVNDSASWLDTVSKQKSNFDAEADSILAYMDQYKGYLDADWMKSVRDTLTGARENQAKILEGATNDNEWWSGFGSDKELVEQYGSAEGVYNYFQRSDGYSKKYNGMTHDDIKIALDKLEAGEEKDWLDSYQWRRLLSEQDFEQYSNAGAAIKNPTMTDAESDGRFLWWSWDGDEIGNIVTYSRDNAGMLATANANNVNTQGNYVYRSMKDDEVKIYNYLLAKYGKEKGEEFLSWIMDDLLAREGGARANRLMGIDIPVVEELAIGLQGLGAGVDQWASGVRQDLTNEKQPATVDQYANAVLMNSMDGLGKYAYQATNVIGNMLPSIALSKGLGALGVGMKAAKAAGAVTMSIGAAGNAYADGLEYGMEPWQARTYGTLVGAAEGALEYAMGGIPALRGAEDFVGAKISMIDKTLLRIGAKLGWGVVQEISEEELQNFLEPAFRAIFTHEYDAPTVDELIETAIVTALSTPVMGGGDTIINDIHGSRVALKKYGNKTDALIKEGLESDINTDSYKLATKYQQQVQGKDGKQGKALTGNQIRNLLAANQEQITPKDMKKIQQAAEKRLTDLGQTKDVAKTAELATKRATGQKLTRAEKSFLASSEYGARVANELLPDNIDSEGYSTEWAENIGTRKVNATAYNKKAIRTLIDAIANAEDPATYKSLEERVSEEDKLSVSKNGQATIHSTGKAIDLSKVEVAEFITDKDTGKITDMTLKADGKEVKASEIDYPDDNQAYLFSAVKNIENITPGDATVIIRDYEPTSGLTVGEYLNGIDEAFTYGYHRYSEADMGAGLFTPKLSKEQAKGAYLLGQATRERSDTNKSEAIKRMRTAVEAEAEKTSTEGFVGGYSGTTYNATQAGLLASVSTEGLQNAADLSGRQDVTFNNIGISDQQTKQQWVDAGLAYVDQDADGNDIYVVNDAMLMDERDRRHKAGKNTKSAPKAKNLTITYNKGNGEVVSIDKASIKDAKRSGAVEVAKILHKMGLGTRVEFFSSYLSETMTSKDKKTGKVKPARVFLNDQGVEQIAYSGVYRKSDGTIRVDLNAYNGKGLTLNALSHELTHFIQQWSAEKYKVLADFLIKSYEKTDMTMHERVLKEQARLEGIRGEDVSYDEAFDEVVANAMSKMFDDGKLVERLTELKAQDEKLARKLWEGFKKILAKFIGVYENAGPLFRDTADIMAMKETFEQLQNMFAEALVDASENYQASITVSESQTLTEAGIGFDENTKSVYSLHFSTAYKDVIQVGKKTFDTEAIAKIVAKGTGRSIEDARKWVKSELTIANMVMANPEFLDFEADNRYEAIKKNSDYPQGTVDLSNLCPKREEFTAMFDRLQKKYPNKLFTAQDVAEMRKILAENDITVACGACFVEDRRQLLGEIADTYINMWREAVATGKPLQKTNAAGVKSDLLVTKALAKQYGITPGTKIMATDTYIPNQYDLTTYEGFKLLEKNHPTIAMGFNRYNNSRGQQSARLIEGRAEYNRQILGWSDAKVRSVNNNGGLRIFSFSDFEVVHLLDLVQVIIDCAAKGVKIQGYTKIPAFAKLVRGTGIKLNRSLIPKGDYGYHMENGKVVLDYDNTEGIDINDDNFIDESNNPDVGNIVIGINPTQIGAAMLDPFIDYIIPFHSNKAKEILKKLGTGEWVNYKESQHEKDISTGKASKHNVNIYTEVINKYHPKDKVEFVNAFLKECKRQGKIPRYAEFLNVDANGDYAYREGYHKLLVDFKMFDADGNILPQENITPNLDEAFMKDLLSAEIDRKQNYEFPQKVYDDIDKKFGEQYSSQETGLDDKGKSRYDITKLSERQLNRFFSKKPIKLTKTEWKLIESQRKAKYSSLEEHEIPIIDVFSIGDDRVINNAYLYFVRNTDANTFSAVAKKRHIPDIVWTRLEEATNDQTRNDAETGERTSKEGGNQGHNRGGDIGTGNGSELQGDAQRAENRGESGQDMASGNSSTDSRPGVKDQFSSQETDADNAPTFYSKMGKVVEGIKQEKFGASSVISMLRGRGVKAEEIRWSGIQAFLDGKKSVTKSELLEFIKGSMLHIEEEHRGSTDNKRAGKHTGKPTKWDEYKLDGGENYRELVFKMPGATYTNMAMQGHWGVEAQGVLAHARMQDFDTADGKRMLFIEEIQSDWHNQGHKEGYRKEGEKTERMLRAESKKAYEEFYTAVEKMLEDNANWEDDNAIYYAHPVVVAEMFDGDESHFEELKFTDEQKETIRAMVAEESARQEALKTAPKQDMAPDAPFKENYHEFVLKRLLRMAAEEGYDSIGWTTADLQMERWNPGRQTNEMFGIPSKNPNAVAFEEGYSIEYDKKMRKFMEKFGRQWGTTVGKTDIQTKQLSQKQEENLYMVADILEDGEDYIRHEKGIKEVWSMDITPAMKKSVLKEGQELYSSQETDLDRDGNTMSDRAKEILASAKPKGIGKNETANIEFDTVIELFNELNADKDIQSLAKRVFKVAKDDHYGYFGYGSYGEPKSHLRLPMAFVGKNGIPDGVHGQFRKNTIWGDIVFSYEYFMDESVAPQSKASTILHEVIHAITCSHIESAYRWMQAKHGMYADPLAITDFDGVDERIKSGIELIAAFEQVRSAPTKDGKNLYGQLTAYEMVAEMANVEFRNFLKKQNLWNRIVEAIKRVFGIPNTTAYDAVSDALERILMETTNDADAQRAKIGARKENNRYSSQQTDLDTEGKKLGEDQLEYFEKSMARDRKGRLQVVYHGGTVEYEFDTTRGGKGATQYGPGAYFTDSEYYAKEYTWYRGGNVRAYYLNIEKMFDDTNMDATVQMPQWKKLEQILRDNGIEDKFINGFANNGFAYMSRYLGNKAGSTRSDSWGGSEILNGMLREAGFDGIKGTLNDVYQYTIFTPNQAKLTTNEVPSTFYDTRYSEHDTDYTNRDLLANAFEWVVQNSEEYKLIQEYRSRIKLLNEQEAKLSKLNAEIREIRFTEGKYDAKKLKELEAEAKNVAKEINRQDKKLLSLEASEPLRKVIEQERKKEAQKTKDHVKEIQQNKKVRAEQAELRHKIRKAVRDLDKLLNRGNKKMNVKEDMKGFVSKALELADYLFTDHISNDELIRRGITVRMTPKEEALVKETEDIISQLYDNADSLTDEEFTRLDAKRKSNLEKLRDLLTAQRNERLNTPVYNLFNDLVTEYASLKNSKQEAVKAAYDPNVERFLRSYIGEENGETDSDRKTLLQNMRVADMTKDELWKLHNAYTQVLHSVRNANNLWVKGKTETIEQMAGRIMGDFTKRQTPDGKVATVIRNLSNKIGWDYEKLYYALDRIGSEAFTELVMNIADSENIVMQDVMEAAAFRDEMVKKYGFNNWAVNKEIDREFLDNTGKKFKLTLGQLMALYAYSRREGAWDHIEYGGFVFGEAALTNPKPADSYKLSKAQCEAITDTLTKEQKAYAEEMQKYLSEVMGAKGNEVSMLLYGIKMFGEKNYFPIHIAGQFKAQAQESQTKAAAGFSSMSNAGFTHAQNPNAKAPFVLEGFNDIWADHVNEMSRYHGTVPALEDMRRVMNRSFYSESGAESIALKQMMENAYGKEAVEYFNNLYREANSGAITDKLQNKSHKLLSMFRKNSVAYSLSVLVQQPASLVRAYAMIDKKYFGFKGFGAITSGVAKAVTSKWNKAYANSYNEMLKYAPGVTMAKEIGGFDTHTGGSIRSYLLDTNKKLSQKWKTGTVAEKGKAVLDLVDDNAIANLPSVADKIAWIEIWNACKRETVATHKDLTPNSEEFMQAVGDRFTEVIRATQVYDSMFSKSPMLKSKNLAVQYLVSFMNEPNTVANMAESAVRDATRGNWKGGVKKAAVLIHAIIFTNVLKSLIYAMRDDDEEETYIEKYIEAVAGNMMNDFNALNYIPIARDVWSLAQGYDVERADMAIVADAIDALTKVIKNATTDTDDMTEEQLVEFDKKVTEANWKLVESLASFFGIPVKNIRREIEGVINTAKTTAANAGKITKQSVLDNIYEAVVGSIPFMSTPSKQDKLYEAIISGDKAYVERLKAGYKNDDAYHTAVRKALRENDSRIKAAASAKYNGNTEEYKRIFREIQNEGRFSFDDIMSAINTELSKLTPDKVTSDYTANGYVEAIAMGNTSEAQAMKDDIIATKIANGKTETEAEEAFASDVVTGIKNAYTSGLLDEARAEEMLMEYADKDEEEASSKVSYWAFCEEHPEYDLSESNVEKYQEFAEPAEIPLDVFVQYVNGTKGLADIKDEWGDVEVTKREQVLEVIDSLPLTWQQKDALYLAAEYSENKIWDVPW